VRRAKIVCTLGPATDAPGITASLVRAGMNVARLNFSHGSHDDHLRRLQEVRGLAAAMGRPLAILQDLCGPKLRLGEIAGGPVQLVRGRPFTLSSRPVPGSALQATLDYPGLLTYLHPGQRILLGDGLPMLRVDAVGTEEVQTTVTATGTIVSHQGVNVPDTALPISAVTEKDLADLDWGIANGVDWVAASFVRQAADLDPLRARMQQAGVEIPIIAKIEKREAIANLDAIIAAADGIMVARGDLGVEMPLDQVPILQKQIIQRCNLAGKPVITATQMLESMIANPRPTRAEVSDIANAILDGTDAVMLSGETAVGKYPRQAASTMARVAARAEGLIDYTAARRRLLELRSLTVTEAISESSTAIAHDLGVRAIITSTDSGYTARMVSRYRPRPPILAVTPREDTYRRLALVWGICPILVPPYRTTDEMVHQAITAALHSGQVRRGDTVVITAGVPVGVPGQTNLIRVGVVGESLQ